MIASCHGSDDKPIQWVEKQRLPTKVHIIKDMAFPVVIYGCKSWIIKKAEHRRIDAFELQVLEKTPESPLDSKEIKSANPKGNQP